jgi:hypothetical protein
MNRTLRLRPTLSLVLMLGAFLLPHWAIPSPAWAEKDGFKQGEEQTSRKKKYIHPCPGGTEQVGKPPQEGGTQVFCRQPVMGGYIKHGPSITWHENGQKHFEGEYYADKKHGKWITYDRNGRRKAQEEWFDGKLVKKADYDKNGAAVEKPDRRALRDEKKKENSWRKQLRTKVEKKKTSERESWVKRSSRTSRSKLF